MIMRNCSSLTAWKSKVQGYPGESLLAYFEKRSEVAEALLLSVLVNQAPSGQATSSLRMIEFYKATKRQAEGESAGHFHSLSLVFRP